MIKRFLFFVLLALQTSALVPIPPDLMHQTSIQMVKTTTALLPLADGIGHHILHFNEFVINKLLDNPNIDMSIKKPVILNLIKAAQKGDETGGYILKNYEILVDRLLN